MENDIIQDYAEIDGDGIVLNLFRLTQPTILYNGNRTILSTGNGLGIGWKYVDGQFINPNPPPVISQPIIMPPAPTLSELQAQIVQLQMHISTLQGTL